MPNPSFLTVRDLRAVVRVLRYVNTADTDIQHEAFRLVRKIEKHLDHPKP
jgi:hypothetical protein